jgi:hypothetical protein
MMNFSNGSNKLELLNYIFIVDIKILYELINKAYRIILLSNSHVK